MTAAGLGAAVVVVGSVWAAAGPAKGGFARTTIDMGIVVSDVEKAAAFYKNALGFTEVPGFDVSAEMGRNSGLTDGHAFHVRVFVLGNEPTATKIKLIEFPKVASKKVDHTFIHSSLGFSYLTVFVTDTATAVDRALKAGATLVKRKPYRLRGGKNYLTLVRDPDGNIIELVGPGG
jgi:catechol 2,3-dioxygenase-like lactoylglutathione lyase family enzyme